MFGYVNVNKAELKVKDFFKYKAYYCGLCKTLHQKYGRLGQMTLSYDMTFLIILLTSLYESETEKSAGRCITHPVRKHDTLTNEITGYVADMNIALSYHHFLDDWQDERNILGLTGAKALEGAYKKINKRYPRQCREISEALSRLAQYEKNKEESMDAVAGCFGELMAALFTYKEDRWKGSLQKVGFYLGKYIYILDAYDDIEKDRRHGSYNPLLEGSGREGFQEECRGMLTMMMADCTGEFEKLPCLQDIDILRNILYDGVWIKFEQINKKRTKERLDASLEEGTKV
ncbi:MAG TPA: hypothetical protein GXX75_20570 [Clostridiales bacterium]|nr:hypothetical protein [Clostridiales bacterium]